MSPILGAIFAALVIGWAASHDPGPPAPPPPPADPGNCVVTTRHDGPNPPDPAMEAKLRQITEQLCHDLDNNDGEWKNGEVR